MSESSAGDSSAVKVLHYVERRQDYLIPIECIACKQMLSDAADYRTDEVILYHNPPEDFIQCTPPSAQQELDLDPAYVDPRADPNYKEKSFTER